MPGVSYALADFVTGGPIVDLPVLAGASWGSQLNRPDSVECAVSLKDADALKLDLRSAAEPKKTVLLARATDTDIVLAWGLLNPRTWDEDSRVLGLSATGVRGSWLGKSLVAPSSARTATLIVPDAEGDPSVNPALDTTLNDLSYGSMGKRLVQQRLAWPGAPSAAFILPADEVVAGRTKTWAFSTFKNIDAALTDLSNLENGPDFAFDAQRAPDKLKLLYVMRHGSETQPRIGTFAGSWSLGGESPITGLKITDNGDDMATASWSTAGRTGGTVLAARALNTALIDAGYPPLDIVDTSHGDVSVQATLDSYTRANLAFASTPDRTLSFSVRGDAKPGLGEFRPGDTVTIDVPDSHPFLVQSFDVRITSISGDETGKSLKIGCVILNAS